jgi:hypothetical protein
MLDAFRPDGDHGYLKIVLKSVSPIVKYGGAIYKISLRKHNRILMQSRSSSSTPSGMHRFKVFLDRLSLLPVSCCFWETDFRINSHTIKRSSRMSILIVSFRVNSKLFILCIIFLGFFILSMWSFKACGYSYNKL